MVTEVKEKKAKKAIKPELRKAIKEFFSAGMSVNEVATKLSIPYHLAYYYSPTQKKRMARIKRSKANGKATRATDAGSLKAVVTAKINDLENQKSLLDAQIDALKGLL
jgi:hypothetical protein